MTRETRTWTAGGGACARACASLCVCVCARDSSGERRDAEGAVRGIRRISFRRHAYKTRLLDPDKAFHHAPRADWNGRCCIMRWVFPRFPLQSAAWSKHLRFAREREKKTLFSKWDWTIFLLLLKTTTATTQHDIGPADATVSRLSCSRRSKIWNKFSACHGVAWFFFSSFFVFFFFFTFTASLICSHQEWKAESQQLAAPMSVFAGVGDREQQRRVAC